MDSLLPCKDLTFRGIGHLDYARVAFLSKPKHTLSLSLSFPPPPHTHTEDTQIHVHCIEKETLDLKRTLNKMYRYTDTQMFTARWSTVHTVTRNCDS